MKERLVTLDDMRVIRYRACRATLPDARFCYAHVVRKLAEH